MQVEYYFETANHLGGNTLTPPAGSFEPFNLEIQIVVPALQLGIAFTMMAILFFLIWGGLGVSLKKMLASENEKGFGKKKMKVVIIRPQDIMPLIINEEEFDEMEEAQVVDDD